MSEDNSTQIRVLVVDDQGTMRSIIRQLLNRVGIDDVTEAENGEDALAFLQDRKFDDPDVIICDLHMDKMDGMEFCNHVRREDEMRDRLIPILILTGDKDTMLHEVSRQVGATAILTKPISAPDLLHEIENAIGFAVEA